MKTIAVLNTELCASGIGKQQSPVKLLQWMAQLDSTRTLVPPVPPFTPPTEHGEIGTSSAYTAGTLKVNTATGFWAMHDNVTNTTTIRAIATTATINNSVVSSYRYSFWSCTSAVNSAFAGHIGEVFDATNIVSIDVSRLAQLSILTIPNNPITTLNLSGLTQLSNVDCQASGSLTSLNANGCTNLYQLHTENSNLSTIDLTGCANLAFLYCSNNPNLTALDCSDSPLLGALNCQSCNLSSLDLTGCNLMQTLDCGNNPSLNDIVGITGMGLLWWLSFDGSQMGSGLDLTSCTQLIELHGQNSSPGFIAISYLSNLQIIDMNGSGLFSLSTPGCSSLVTVSFTGGTAGYMNFDGAAALTDLIVDFNSLHTLTLYYCPLATYVTCTFNAFNNSEVSQVLVDLDSNSSTGGSVDCSNNVTLTGSGIDARNNLLGKGWTVIDDG